MQDLASAFETQARRVGVDGAITLLDEPLSPAALLVIAYRHPAPLSLEPAETLTLFIERNRFALEEPKNQATADAAGPSADRLCAVQ